MRKAGPQTEMPAYLPASAGEFVVQMQSFFVRCFMCAHFMVLFDMECLSRRELYAILVKRISEKIFTQAAMWSGSNRTKGHWRTGLPV